MVKSQSQFVKSHQLQRQLKKQQLVRTEQLKLRHQDQHENALRAHKECQFKCKLLRVKLEQQHQRVGEFLKAKSEFVFKRKRLREQWLLNKTTLLDCLERAKRAPDNQKQLSRVISQSTVPTVFSPSEKVRKHYEEEEQFIGTVIQHEEDAEEERRLLISRADGSQRRLLEKHLAAERVRSTKKLSALSRQRERLTTWLGNNSTYN